MRGEGAFRLKSWLKAGLGICLVFSAGAAAVVAGRFDCTTFDLWTVLVLCGETAAGGEVVANGCEIDGRLLESDRKALEPGLIAAFIAILCYRGVERSELRNKNAKEADVSQKLRTQSRHELFAQPRFALRRLVKS